MTVRDWDRLARYVRERRNELGFTQEEVAARGGPSTATLRLLEGGEQTSYRPKSLRQLEDALGWRTGSVQAILAGMEPSPASSSRGPEPRYADPALQHIWETPGLSDEVKRGLISLAIGMRQTAEDERRGA